MLCAIYTWAVDVLYLYIPFYSCIRQYYPSALLRGFCVTVFTFSGYPGSANDLVTALYDFLQIRLFFRAQVVVICLVNKENSEISFASSTLLL